MKEMMKTYRWLVYFAFAFALVFVACSSADMSEDESRSQKVSPSAEATEEVSASATEETKATISNLDAKKWKNKAKQQLESIQDLTLILKDSTLDVDFKSEIEKELNILYPSNDSLGYKLNQNEVDFSNFKALQIENQNTLSLLFKNKKEQLKAVFIVVNETKTFGETSEEVETLKLISIRKVE